MNMHKYDDMVAIATGLKSATPEEKSKALDKYKKIIGGTHFRLVLLLRAEERNENWDALRKDTLADIENEAGK